MSDLPDFRKLWNFQKPDETEQKFREILPQAEAGGDLNYTLELKTQIGRTLGLQKKFDEAHALLDEVASALDESTKVARLRYLLERGRTFNSGGSPDKAQKLFEEAWEYGTALPHPSLAVDAAHMLAIVVPDDEKDAWNEQAMRYAEESGDADAANWLGALYNNMGWDAHDRGDFDRALELHTKCWDWHKERTTGGGERIAKWSVAKQLRFLGRGAEALPMQHELLAEYADEEPGGEGFVHEEIGELMHASGDDDGARPHFAKAHEMLRKYDWVEKDRLERLKQLGS